MKGSFIDTCVDRPVFASMMTLAIIALGIISYQRLGVDLLPRIESPQVTVFTALPGAAPEEIESTISKPIEEQLNTIAGIDELRSVNRDGFSFVLITFNVDRRIDEAVQDVRDKLARVQRSLPEGTDPPIVSTFDSDSSPILSIVASGSLSVRELTEVAETQIKDALGTATGVGAVTIEGGSRRTVWAMADVGRLAAAGLSLLDVKRALERQNVEVPGGRLTRGNREDIVRTMGRVSSVQQLADVRINATVRLADVATVIDGVAEVRGAARLDGNTAVTLQVQKLAGANIVDTARAVKQRVVDLQSRLPAGVQLTIVRDASVFIEASVAEARFHLVGGALLAALAVLLFIGSWRAMVVAAVAIPASIIGTFPIMEALGFTLNNITLLGLTLAVGVVIDDAIVVVEAIHRRIHEGVAPREAAKEATRSIALAVIATTLSLVVIFFPVAFLRGQLGQLFASYGITVSAALLVSMFVALTLTPMMAARILKKDDQGWLGRQVLRWMTPVENGYAKLVEWSLRHRAVVVVCSAVVVISTVPLYLRTPTDFLPEDDQGEFEIAMELPSGTAFTGTDTVVRQVEAQVREIPDVAHVLVSIGDPRGSGSASRALFYVQMTPLNSRATTQADAMKAARAITQRFGDARPTVRSLSTINIGGVGYGGKLRVALRGPDIAVLEQKLQLFLREARKEPGLVDVFSPAADRLPEVRAIPDRARMSMATVDVATIAETLRVAVGGDQVSSYLEDNERYEVWLRAQESDRNSMARMGALPVRGGNGALVPLSSVSTLIEQSGPTVVLRLNGMRQVLLSSNPAPGTALSDGAKAIDAAVARLDLPPGYDHVLLGDAKTLDQTRLEFLWTLLASLVFVYMILAALFESTVHPVTIMLAIPLTAPFALLSLWLFKDSLNVYSILGIFMLFGIVKKNGVLQVDATNQLLAQGMSLHDAIVAANRMRLRPILMTTMTLVAALLPMTVASGPGAASRAAMARVVVGGQALSLLITLLIVPVATSLIEQAKQRLRTAAPAGTP